MTNRGRFVIAVLVVNNVTACFAAFGQCVLLMNPQFLNTIGCGSDECSGWSNDPCKAANAPTCRGMMQVITKQTYCNNSDSTPCTETPYWFIVQRPPVVDLTGNGCIGYSPVSPGWQLYLPNYYTVYYGCVPGPPVYQTGGGRCD